MSADAKQLTVVSAYDPPRGCALLGCGREVLMLRCECVEQLPDALRDGFRTAFWAWDRVPTSDPNGRFAAFKVYADRVGECQRWLRERVLGQREAVQEALPL